MIPRLIPEQDEVMAILKRTGAYREGHFVYPSGQHTPHYFQMPLAFRYYDTARVPPPPPPPPHPPEAAWRTGRRPPPASSCSPPPRPAAPPSPSGGGGWGGGGGGGGRAPCRS